MYLSGGTDMRLRDIMTANPLVLSNTNTIKDAATLFINYQTEGAPVVDSKNKFIGSFTSLHINRAVSNNMDKNLPVEVLMDRDVATGHPDDSVEDLVYFNQGQVPVLENGRIVGIITGTDFARAVAERNEKISSELSAIIDSTPYLLIATDEQGRINVFNRTSENILGISEKDVEGKNISEIFPDINSAEVIRKGKESSLQKIFINGKPYIGLNYPIKKNGTITGAVFRFQDITDLENISDELQNVKELNQDLDAIIESSYDGIWVTDGNGNVLRINKAYEMITGLPCTSFYGRNMTDLVKEGYFSQSVTLLVLEEKSQQTIFQETKTGKTLLVTGNPVFDEHHNITRVVTNVRDITELKQLIERLDESQKLAAIYHNELNDLRKKYVSCKKIIGNSSKLQNILDTVCRLAQVNSTILILGESGTGKELIAEYLHEYSMRAKMPLIKINCGAIPENLIESELFGYESGAFTGAKKGGKPGYFELANNGTLFLDEIAEMPLNLQTKLLRVMESEEVTRIGGEKSHKIDVRIIAATNKNLYDMVHQGKFREDLYYRLNVVPINIPPLRERKEDIVYLIAHFVSIFNREYKMTRRIAPDVVEICMKYDWPGNIRELKNLVERMMVMAVKDVITKEDLLNCFKTAAHEDIPQILITSLMPLNDAVMSVEKQLLERAYASCRTTREMAKELKIDASTVVRKAAKYGVSNIKCKVVQ
jgi:PAS domain S-box-containing protein